MASAADDQWVAPGDRLGQVAEYEAGAGTYVRGAHVVASLVGCKQVVGDKKATTKATLVVQSVAHAAATVPEVGSLVTVKVTRITKQLANVAIVCVGDVPLQEPFSGIIRKENIREMEIDKVGVSSVLLHPSASHPTPPLQVQVANSFRPGDVVRAKVVSLGDRRSYYLSTARVELGVVHATAAGTGTPLVPISWQEMQDPTTRAREFRKVAKVAV